jgi:hypothetical protein
LRLSGIYSVVRLKPSRDILIIVQKPMLLSRVSKVKLFRVKKSVLQIVIFLDGSSGKNGDDVDGKLNVNQHTITHTT